MLQPKCPRNDCNGVEFKGIPGSIFDYPNKHLIYVCCSKCGAVVGVLDSDLAEEVDKILKKVK